MKLRNELRKITVTHIAEMSAILIITFAVIGSGLADIRDPDTDSVVGHLFLYLVPIVAIVGLVTSLVVFRRGLNSARKKETALEKISSYKGTLNYRMRIYETITTVGILGLITTRFWLNLAVVGLMIVLMIITFPGKTRILKKLNINDSEPVG